MWSAEQAKGSKRVKAEVAVKFTSPEDENQPERVTQEAYELMIKGKWSLVQFKQVDGLYVYAQAVPVNTVMVNICCLRVMDCSCNLVLNGLVLFFLETPGSSYWKQVAEERRRALFSVLQENEKVG